MAISLFIRKLSARPPSRKRPGDHPLSEPGLAASWKVAHQRPEEQLDSDLMLTRKLSSRPPSRKRKWRGMKIRVEVGLP